MQQALLIAEKPDLMRKIKAVYDAHRQEIPYQITFQSQRGHLVTLQRPDELDDQLKHWSWDTLPIEPEDYGGWKYSIISEKKTGNFLTSRERYEQIKTEIESGKYDFVIHAGDPDQEGELLVNIVLRRIGNKLPVKRFWTNATTEAHLLKALHELKDDDKDPMLVNLMEAAYTRQHSDWRFGMNITRAAALKMRHSHVRCGRVRTPILSIVCKREEEIRNFVPKTVYGLKAEYEEGFSGVYFDRHAIVQNDENATDEQKQGIVWFETKEEAEEARARMTGPATVMQYMAKRVESYAPKLYKLATIQVEAGKKGYNDAQTLEAIQKLYEAGYVTYPRTDCEYISAGEDFKGILAALGTFPDYAGYTEGIAESDIARVRSSKRWVNDKALADAGHSALCPTDHAPDLTGLPEIQKDIYDMIARRFLAMFLPPLVQDKALLVTAVNEKYLFRSAGKTLVDPGYTVLFDTKFTDAPIPEHAKGDKLAIKEITIPEKTTTCPKRYTSPELIKVCENPLRFLDDQRLKALGKQLKIGTSATRSGIIRSLIDTDKYLEEYKEKKTTYLRPTPFGMAVAKNLEGLLISRVDMTGLWEEKLNDIRSGKRTRAEVEEEMRHSVRDMLEEIKGKDMKELGAKQVGVCPVCGKPLMENDKGYFCSGYKEGCRVGVFKEYAGCTFTLNDLLAMAKKQEIVKEKGRVFYYDTERSRVMERSLKTQIPCPNCDGYLSETTMRYQCDCGFRAQKTIASHRLTEVELRAIGENGHTELISDFVSKKGKNFTASLVLKEGNLEFEFPERTREGASTQILCPCCKTRDILENEKAYFCDCGLLIWKEIAKRKIKIEEIERLAESGETGMLDGFVSKKKKRFSANLVLNPNTKKAEFAFDDI